MKRHGIWVLVWALVLTGIGGTAATSATAHDVGEFLVGRGIADITGEPAENGMMGYGRIDQQSRGIHNRQHARAFVIQDARSDDSVLLVVAEYGMTFESVHQEVLRRLEARYGDWFNLHNTMLVGTHTHAAAGGFSHHLLYNITTMGFHEKSFNAIVDGIVRSVDRAVADLQPTVLRLAQGEVNNASVNRSMAAFSRNKEDIKQEFPLGIDPLMTNLLMSRQGQQVGVVNWFGVHATSMSGDNQLLSSDNKGYAAYRWEQTYDVDYRADQAPFVAAFAQNNAGDISPNLDLTPPTTPADFARTVDNGTAQYDGARRIAASGGDLLTPGVESRLVYVDFDRITVDAEFTGDGQQHFTCDPVAGAAMAAGSTEDGPAGEGFYEGKNNPFFDKMSPLTWTFRPELKACQYPKDVLINGGNLNKVWPWVQTRLPVQLVRIGQLWLLGYPGELTAGAGYRLRSTVAQIVGAPLDHVIMSSYNNAYNHYMTTPEEYDAQAYEGGSTLFGRWQVPAMQQVYAGLARGLVAGEAPSAGALPPDLSGYQLLRQPGVVLDVPGIGNRFGDVLREPQPAAVPGEQVSAVFVGAHPSNNLHSLDSYTEVQRREGSAWVRVADDNDWSTLFEWERHAAAQSRVTVTWTIPADVHGTYRLVYRGDSKVAGVITPFVGSTRSFTVE